MKRVLFVLLLAAVAAAVAVPVQASTPTVERVVTVHGNVVEFDNAAGVAHVQLASNWVTVPACAVDGLYGYSADQATNGAGQTLRWEFAVDLDNPADCVSAKVRYWQRLSCSGNVSSPWCNFSADGGFMFKDCLPSQSCTVNNFGFAHLTSCPSDCNKTSTTITGNWHFAGPVSSYKTCSTDFYVHFLNPDNYSQHRQRSSKWYMPNDGEYAGATCQP